MSRWLVAGGLGFEPRLTESETAVLPLDDPPTRPRAGKSIAGFGKPQPPRAQARTGCGPYIGRTFVTVYPGLLRAIQPPVSRGGVVFRLGRELQLGQLFGSRSLCGTTGRGQRGNA